jgi:hypothetical protein
MDANSTPTAQAAIMANDFGSFLRDKASLFVTTVHPSASRPESGAVSEPVAMTMCRARISANPRLRPSL